MAYYARCQKDEAVNGQGKAPVSFIQDDDLVPAQWQRNFLLSKHLDFVPDDVYPSAHTYTRI